MQPPSNTLPNQIRRDQDQLEIDNMPAAIIKSLKQSVLGMSFLSRLKGVVMRNGVLTRSRQARQVTKFD
jgi:hypothetical protein